AHPHVDEQRAGRRRVRFGCGDSLVHVLKFPPCELVGRGAAAQRRRSDDSAWAIAVYSVFAALRNRFRLAAGGHGRRHPPQQEGPELMKIGLEHYLFVSALLFAMGLLGVLLRRNLLIIYMSLELMLNAANLALVAASRFNNNL